MRKVVICCMFLIMCCQLCVNVVATSKIEISYLDKVIAGLEGVKYQSVTGGDTTIDFRQLMTSSGYPAFFVGNPKPNLESNGKIVKGTEKLYTIAGAIIGEAYTHSLSDVEMEQGITLTQDEYNATIQMAISEAIGSVGSDVKLDLTSIRNNGVLSVSAWLQSLANNKYNEKDYEMAFSKSVAAPSMFINDGLAAQSSDANFVYFGPYTAKILHSIVPDELIEITSGAGSYALVDSVGGIVVDKVKQGETFYVRVDKVASDLTVTLKSVVPQIKLKLQGDILYLDTEDTTVSGSITIGKGEQIGKLSVSCIDMSGKPVEGVRLTVSFDKTVVETLVTSSTGQAVTDFIPLGNYSVRMTYVPDKFVFDDSDFQVAVNSLAGITPLQISMRESVGYVDVRVRDLLTNTVVQGAAFSLLKDNGEFVMEVTTDEQGNSLSIPLPHGAYKLQETLVPNGYAMMSSAFSFSVTSGNTTVVTLKMEKGESYITFLVLDDKDVPIPYAQFEVYRDSGETIGTFTTNNLGIYSCFMLSGKYLARSLARESMGEGDIVKFTVELSEPLNIDMRGTYAEAKLSGIVLSEDRTPLQGVGLVALNEDGTKEISFGYTGEFGEYELTEIPIGSVVFIKVYSGVSGYSNTLEGNRLIITGANLFKDFILYKGDETLDLYTPLGVAPVIPTTELLTTEQTTSDMPETVTEMTEEITSIEDYSTSALWITEPDTPSNTMPLVTVVSIILGAIVIITVVLNVRKNKK